MKTSGNYHCFSNTDLLVLRVYAGVCLLLCTVYITLIINKAGIPLPPVLAGISCAADFTCALIAVILLVHPEYWSLWIAFHTIEGLKLGFFNTDLLGLLIYSAGWLIAQRAGFFHTAQKRKISVVILVFAALVAEQLRIHGFGFFSYILKVLFASVTFIVIAVLFREKFSTAAANRAAPDAPPGSVPPAHGDDASEEVILRKYRLTWRELCYLYALTENMPYKEIADRLNVSESAIKKGMIKLFSRFNFTNQNDFRIFLQNHKLVYPAGFVPQKFFKTDNPPPEELV